MRRIGRAVTCVAVMALIAVTFSWAGGPRHFPRGGGAAGPDGSVRLSVGLFSPDGDSGFWEESEALFTGDIDDFEDMSFRAEFEWGLGERASVLASLGYYDGSSRRADRLEPSAVHTATLEVTPLTLGVLLAPGGRGKRVVPYLLAGVGFYSWQYTEVGDFFTPDGFIEFDAFESDGVTTGLFAGVGIELAIAPATSLFAEGRWVTAEDDLADEFAGFGTLDLSGSDLSLGVAWRF